MAGYLLKRLIILFSSLFLVSLILFALLRLLPGDLAQIIAGTDADPQQVERLRVELGLNQSWLTQYWDWLSALLRFDLGNSAVTGVPIAHELWDKAGVTVPLAILGLLIALLISYPLGTLRGIYNKSSLLSLCDSFFQALSYTPALWLGLILIMLSAKGIGIFSIFPANGANFTNFGQLIYELFLPALTLALVVSARLFRVQRVSVEEAKTSDFVRFGASLGYTRNQALVKYGIPTTLMPVVTTLTITFAQMFTGVVVIEKLFVLPGIGTMLVNDLARRDLVKVQTELMFLTAVVLLLGVLVDVIGAVLDPRLRVGGTNNE
ncbi:MAG: ABC transporter permease [Bifidobacteriaceae bacterium]|jgi:peptide/nickel transport system permease protein|nr:ABC transporter permease [Bifidobacteriaceae bacterium]